MKRKSSLRRTAAPMPVALMASPPSDVNLPSDFLVVLLGGLLRAAARCHRLGAGRDGFDDVVVAGATAEIALELLADGLVVELVALAIDDVDRRHDHARRAEAALQAMI